MSERHVRGRKAGSRRKSPVQKTFVTLLEPEPDQTPAPIETAAVAEASYRTDLATWPLRWRERWGRRANAFEDQGLDWRSAELAAFHEVGEERRRKSQSKRGTVALAGPN